MYMVKYMTIFLMAFLFACSERTVKESASNKVQDVHTKTINTNTANVMFQHVPSPLPETSDTGLAGKDAYIYFNAGIVLNASEKRSTYAEAAYLNFGIENNFMLIAGNDTISPAFCHRIVGNNKNVLRYIIAFPQPEASIARNDLQLYLDDQQLGVGKVSATFNINFSKATN